ncbi:MAG: nitrite reductase (NAD(P)H) small subunit [Rhodobiaceae bacterium]|nr:MAG: nitrite reductase (NAD(P)H) small subunit [Rhodobiaceae bacterium]
MSEWISIGQLADIPPRGARKFKEQGVQLAVFRTSTDQVFALEDKCPHLAGPLSDGIVHDTGVTCPLHNWVIDLETGHVRGPDQGCVAKYEVKTVDGEIFLARQKPSA